MGERHDAVATVARVQLVHRPYAIACSGALLAYLLLSRFRLPNRYKECTGKSIERLEAEKAEKAALEGQARAQAQANCTLAKQLADAQDAGAVAQSLADAWAAENTSLRTKTQTLSAALAAAEARIADLEAVRRKLHNTIMVSGQSPDDKV